MCFLESTSLFPWQPKVILHPVEHTGVCVLKAPTILSHAPTLCKKTLIIMLNLVVQMFDAACDLSPGTDGCGPDPVKQ